MEEIQDKMREMFMSAESVSSLQDSVNQKLYIRKKHLNDLISREE